MLLSERNVQPPERISLTESFNGACSSQAVSALLLHQVPRLTDGN